MNNFIEKLILYFQKTRNEDNSEYLSKIINDYKQKRPIYEEFRIVVHNAIESILKNSGYKYQISSRTKTIERLEGKIIRKKNEDKYYNSINDIEDLVGLRVIFYTEKDKNAFIDEIKRELSVSIKIEDKNKSNGYNAVHLIMCFGDKRLKLSEYKHFKGLKSEIQITSIFHHAWAEIEHDLVYKDIYGLKQNDPEKYILIKDKMNHLSEKYIKTVTSEMEEIMDLIK